MSLASLKSSDCELEKRQDTKGENDQLKRFTGCIIIIFGGED